MSQAISSTQSIPDVGNVPKHVAIIMDGNGRWATNRGLPRVWGHKKGAQTVREIVRTCAEIGVENLTLLMKLFMRSLRREIKALAENGIELRVIGELSAFDPVIQNLIKEAHEKTCGGKSLTLTISANYGGRWDILNAMNGLLAHRVAQGMPLDAPVLETDLTPFLQLSDLPEPDLFIRTGGEARVSNFLLWQLAYTELYFTPTYWPDFDRIAFLAAVSSYQQRERRFGRTSAQLKTQ